MRKRHFCQLSTIGYGLGDGVGGCPGSLEIEASSNAVDVEHLANKIQMGPHAALEGCGIDTPERHAAAGDKLVAKRSAPSGVDAVAHHGTSQPAEVFFADVHPTKRSPFTHAFLYNVFP